MAESFFCPRGPGPDSPFKVPFNGSAHWRDDGTCSYCGSLKAELLFEQIERGACITPTDKNYKVYVDLIDHQVRGAGKFYFQHLDQDQQTRFIELLNQRKIKIGFPGYFYVTPFFARRAERDG